MAIKNATQLVIEVDLKATLTMNRAMLNTMLSPAFPAELTEVFQNGMTEVSNEVRSLQAEFHNARTRSTDRRYRPLIMGCDLRSIA